MSFEEQDLFEYHRKFRNLFLSKCIIIQHSDKKKVTLKESIIKIIHYFSNSIISDKFKKKTFFLIIHNIS